MENLLWVPVTFAIPSDEREVLVLTPETPHPKDAIRAVLYGRFVWRGVDEEDQVFPSHWADIKDE